MYFLGVCKSYWFGILTTLFIYLPSCNSLSVIFGPSNAGFLCSVWGDILTLIGLITLFFFDFWILGGFSWFFLLLGIGLILFGYIGGSIGKKKCESTTTFNNYHNIIKLLLFPIFIIISPLLTMWIKLIIILKPENKFVENQEKVISLR